MDASMNFIKFRYDFLTDDEHPYSILAMLFVKEHGTTVYPSGVMGVETQNARGTQIKRHMHLHFMTDEKPETIRKRFLRKYGNDQEKRGRGWYSLALETDVKDFNHFFRYPIKQMEPASFRYVFDRIPLPVGFDIATQNVLAYEEWTKSKEILTKKENQRDSKLSVYEKILDIVQTTSPNLNTHQECKLFVLNYFLENNIPPSKNKIIDIANGVALTLRLISKEAFLEI